MGGTAGSAPRRKGSLKQGRAFAVPSAAGGRRHAQRPALCRRRRANRAGRSSRPSWWSALRTPLLPGRLARLVMHLCCRWCCKTHPASIHGFQQVGFKVIGLLASSAGPCWLLLRIKPGQHSLASLQICDFTPMPSTNVSESPIAFTRGSGSSSTPPLCWVRRKHLSLDTTQGEGEQRPLCPGHEAWAGPVTGITVPDTSL